MTLGTHPHKRGTRRDVAGHAKNITMPETITREWRPSPKQEKVLALPDIVYEVLYGGAAYGGKTELLGLLPIIRRFHEQPRFKGLLLRRTFPELEREIIPRMMDYYCALGASWNGTIKVWSWPCGARIFCGHIEKESDVRKYDTSEFNYIAFDELTSFTEFQYLYLAGSRCRSSVEELPAFLRAGTNPGNIGNSWVKKRFKIDSIPSGTIIRDKVTGKLRTFIPALPTDNVRVPKERLSEYLSSLDILPEAERRAKKFGDWNAYAGQVFPEFRIRHIPDEPANAIHVVDLMDLPKYWPTIMAIDWGYAAYFYALWAKISPSGRVYIFREYAEKKKETGENAHNVAYLSRNDNIVSIAVDPATKQNKGFNKTNYQQIEDGLGEHLATFLHVAANDRISGKNLIHDYLRWTPRPRRRDAIDGYDEKYAQYILRNAGIEEYHAYMEQFSEEKLESVDDLPKLQILKDTAPILVETLPSCVYNDAEGANKEDVKEFNGDDPYDDLRYLLDDATNYIKDSQNIYDKIKKNQETEDKVDKDHNYHEYFMRRRRELATASNSITQNFTRRGNRWNS